MSLDQAASEILAKLKGRASGAHENIKDAEAHVGGRKLPGGMKGAVAQVVGADLASYQIGEYEGEPYIYIQARCIDPTEFHGISLGFEMKYDLAETKFASAEENLERFYNDMKLIGFEAEIQALDDESEVVQMVYEYMNNKDEEPVLFVFNTAVRERKSKGQPTGDYPVNVQGVPEEGYEATLMDGGTSTAETNGKKKSAKGATAKKQSAPKKGAKGAKGGTPRKKAKTAEVEAPFTENDTVKSTNDHFSDGNDYTGVVQTVGNNFCTVTFDDDGTTSDVPFKNLEKVTATEEAAPFEVGDKVATPKGHFGDNKVYEGTISELTEDSAIVAFDDGDSETFTLDQISIPE